jgi:NAD(P)-dependent dehydrogenase (short-subunit alcohol dehydrogenase family)
MNVQEQIKLDGKTAFITGASRGLGRACALALAEAGADVALAATNTDALEDVAGEVRKLGRAAVISPLDISGSASARSAVGRAAQELGRLDILVNAAGICPRATCLEMSDEEMRTTFEVNVFGTFYVCTEAAKHMQEAAVQKSGGGRIVTFGSVAGIRARPNVPIYGASKSAVQTLSQSMAADWASIGIRVNTIIPGQFDTDMGAPLMNDPDALAAYTKRIPLGRVGQPHEMPGLVVYLCSDASSYVTGGMFIMDGGLTLQ